MDEFRQRGGLLREKVVRVPPDRDRGRGSRNGRRPDRRGDRPRQVRPRVSCVVSFCVGVAAFHSLSFVAVGDDDDPTVC